jgi:Cof subfamily protein (haloacid dehalogenase superfamily)
MTSGRPPQGMAVLIQELQIDEPLAGFNGGVLFRPDFSVIEKLPIPEQAARDAVRLIVEHGLDAWVYTDSQWLSLSEHGPHVDREAKTVGFRPQVVANFDEALGHAVKIVGVSDDYAAVEKCANDCRAALGSHAAASRSQPYYLDVTNPQANKGGVLETLSKRLEIPPDQIATIGDMPTDVDMFRPAGMSIAMGQASQEVQSEADFVTSSNEEEGFAAAIEKFVLPAVTGN